MLFLFNPLHWGGMTEEDNRQSEKRYSLTKTIVFMVFTHCCNQYFFSALEMSFTRFSV